VNKMQRYTADGTPQFIVRPTNELEVFEANLKSRMRSGVGMLLYLIKHSQPYIANVLRDLAKYMDGGTLAT
jgi:hypothetical protein